MPVTRYFFNGFHPGFAPMGPMYVPPGGYPPPAEPPTVTPFAEPMAAPPQAMVPSPAVAALAHGPMPMLVQQHRIDWKRFLPVLDPVARIVGTFAIKAPTLFNGAAASATNMPTTADVYNHISDALAYQRRGEYLRDGALLLREVLDAIAHA